eukprot:scaffold82045_cov60-Phaeocystis_antarctica.AAC.2
MPPRGGPPCHPCCGARHAATEGGHADHDDACEGGESLHEVEVGLRDLVGGEVGGRAQHELHRRVAHHGVRRRTEPG